jgi:DNA-binding IclR family transcriptional regulator
MTRRADTSRALRTERQSAILAALAAHPGRDVSAATVAAHAGIPPGKTRDLLRRLTGLGAVVKTGTVRGEVWRLP